MQFQLADSPSECIAIAAVIIEDDGDDVTTVVFPRPSGSGEDRASGSVHVIKLTWSTLNKQFLFYLIVYFNTVPVIRLSLGHILTQPYNNPYPTKMKA